MTDSIDNFHKRVLALKRLRPDSQYTLLQDNTIQWDSTNSASVPSEADITAEITTLESEIPLKHLRHERNKLLKDSDWTQGEDVPSSIKTPWATYRQQLRDITDTYSSVDDDGFSWPTKP